MRWWRKWPRKAPTAEAARYEFMMSMQTDVGCLRSVNEDCGRYMQPRDDAQRARKGLLAVVADGMGGHSAGEVASRLAVEVISRVYYKEAADAPAALQKAFQEANRRVYEAALGDESLKGMGTTGTALVLQNGSALSAHVGDSRLYLVRGGEIYLMTEDHSEVMEMVKNGLIRLEDARRHANKNVIVRALGVHPEVEVAAWAEPFPVREGDAFLLCSDGLSDLVEEAELKQVVLTADAHSACGQLIALAKARGGYDNITVGIVHVLKPTGGDELRPARATREMEVEQ